MAAVFEKSTFFNMHALSEYVMHNNVILLSSFFTKQTSAYRNNGYLSSKTRGTVMQYFVFEHTYTLPFNIFVCVFISKMDDY